MQSQTDLLSDVDLRPELARKTKRWIAAFLDYFFVAIIVFVISYFFGEEDGTNTTYYVSGAKTASFSRSLTGWSGFFGTFIPWLILLPGIEGINNGQTIGKALMSVRAIREDGGKFNIGNAFLRHIVDFIDYFPFLGIVGLIVASYSRDSRRVGDMVAQTVVVVAK